MSWFDRGEPTIPFRQAPTTRLGNSTAAVAQQISTKARAVEDTLWSRPVAAIKSSLFSSSDAPTASSSSSSAATTAPKTKDEPVTFYRDAHAATPIDITVPLLIS